MTSTAGGMDARRCTIAITDPKQPTSKETGR